MTVFSYRSTSGREVLTVSDRTEAEVRTQFANSRTPLIRVVPPVDYGAELKAAVARLATTPRNQVGIRYDLGRVIEALRAVAS